MNEKLSLFMSKVYGLMMLGVLLTSISAAVVGMNHDLLSSLMSNPVLFFGLIILEIILAVSVMAIARKTSAYISSGLFLLYSSVSGITLSVVFARYHLGDIATALMTTVVGFAGLSIFGFVTKKNLDAIGSFCFMALFGLIGFALLSLFVPSLNQGAIGTVYSLVGLLVFSGLTAYDTQKIKEIGKEDDSFQNVVLGALELYLDFVNMFLYILKLTGNRSDD